MNLCMACKMFKRAMSIIFLCLISTPALAHEDHAPLNPKYETKILKDKAERLDYDTLLALKSRHWKKALHDSRSLKKTLKDIWYIYQHC